MDAWWTWGEWVLAFPLLAAAARWWWTAGRPPRRLPPGWRVLPGRHKPHS
ncbi:MAG: hypothetical protein OWV35_12015 [Firmicutes bacterium]|nr:hypothetical protein [Bacillota bacterium]